ncbi:uncharacterized protein [Choristoneura fumiferana]|uniref:uncharacterized protein n=1 Tax=Choristoneura fumiferana TaxID=7141 RepID=UPI003D15657C
MKNALILDNLWACVCGYAENDKTSVDVRTRRDDIAKSKICLSVEKSCFSHLISAKTAKDAWNALASAYDDKGLGSRVRVLQNLCAVKLENFGSMEVYVNEVLSLAQQLANMNKVVDDEFLGALMLKGLPTEYEPMIMALEHSGAVITADLVKSKLLQDQRWTTRGDSTEKRGFTGKRSVEIFFPTCDDEAVAEESRAGNQPEVENVENEAEMRPLQNVDVQVEAERPEAPEVWFEADEQDPCSSTNTGGVPQEPRNDGPAYNLRPRLPRTMSALEVELNEPTTVKEALQSSDSKLWRQAMQDEIDSFNKHEAWELVDRPADKNIVKNRWLFKIKRDANGKIACYRARLVAKGFTQKFGIDYLDTYSPVVRHSSLRMLLSLAVELDLKIDHLDVKTAFLNGNLSEEIYMSQPEGFIRQGNEHKVYKLKKAVYGLKQASRAWYDKVKEVLLADNFTQSKHESCIFSRRVGKHTIIIALYVDDFFVFYDCDKLAGKLKMSLKSHFTIKDLVLQ